MLQEASPEYDNVEKPCPGFGLDVQNEDARSALLKKVVVSPETKTEAARSWSKGWSKAF